MKSLIPYGLLSVVAIALDQWIKVLVEADLPWQQPVDLLPFLALFRTYNTGIAFSMLSSLGDTGLIVLALAVAAFVIWLAARTEPRQVAARIGFALIVGGARGNRLARAVFGQVLDYVLFHTPVWSFAVFNLADAFITIGAVLVILEEFFGWRSQTRPSDD
ncbi:MAG: signal peptidase II [Mesorhizobium sp.]